MKRVLCSVLSVLALATAAEAQSVPQSIKIQGYLSDRSGGPSVPANGSFTMVFEIFAAPAGGAALASVGPVTVTVTNGVYETTIPAAASVFGGGTRYLQVTVNGELLAPRLSIDSAPYALRSETAVNAESVAPGSVGTAALTPGAVTAAVLADGSVTSPKIGIPCGEGQTLMRTGGVWTCATLQICPVGSSLSCYPGPAGTAGVGLCRAGSSQCRNDGRGFEACTGMVTPVSELCDALDNDCDGQVDEGACFFPIASTDAAGLVTMNSAILNGRANPNGFATTGWFRYSSNNPGTCNDAFGTRVPSNGGVAVGAGTSDVAFAQPIGGLQKSKTYYYCAIASNNSGTAFGAVVSFTTPFESPTVTTLAPTAVTSTSATLNGLANPHGSTTTGYFRYGTMDPGSCNETFGTRAPASGGVALGNGNSDVAYSQAISGLSPLTTYYYCALAFTSQSPAGGAVMAFTTP